MLVVLSPAKNLDFSPSPLSPDEFTQPALHHDAAELAQTTKKLSRSDIKTLMGISDDLANLNHQRFQTLAPSTSETEGRMAAAFAFNGDVYRGFDARSLSQDDLAFAQSHVRHLSGLYGLLRPLDAIEPYRLEMGTRLATKRGANLYAYWGDRVAQQLNADMVGHEDAVVVNLASDEYAKVIDRKALTAPMINVGFKDIKDGKARSLFMYVKRARGLMARWIVRNRITRRDQLSDFAEEGYSLSPDMSIDGSLVFTRPQPAKKAA